MAAGSLHLPAPPGNRSALAAAAKGSPNCDSTLHSAELLNINIQSDINHFDFLTGSTGIEKLFFFTESV